MPDLTSNLFFLAQKTEITYWLTPVWLLSVGIAIGFLLSLAMVLKLSVLQKIPFFNSITESSGRWHVFSLALAAAYLALYLAFYYFNYGSIELSNNFLLALTFVVPTCLLVGYAAWVLTSKRMSGEIWSVVNEGFLWWINRVCLVFTVFALLGFLLAPFNGFGVVKFVDNPTEMLHSLGRMPYVGTTTIKKTIPPSDPNHSGDVFEVKFDGAELANIFLKSNQKLEFSEEKITGELDALNIYSVDASDQGLRLAKQSTRIKEQRYEKLYINNLGSGPADVVLAVTTEPVIPQVALIPLAATCVVLMYLMYLVFYAMAPKVAAIALSTFKTEVSQPLFMLVVGIGMAFVVLSIFIPYNTFGEDIKLYKDSGLTLIRVLAIFTAIWAASKSVAEEIEGRTALTVLSKPVGRRQFILGKFTGISLAIFLLFVIVGLWFVIFTAYKPVYDGRENSKKVEDWVQCFNEAVFVMPALLLYFLEVITFVGISVAISTRLSTLPNFLICFAIYVLGHLTPQFLNSNLSSFEPVVAFGNLLAVIFPVLDHYSVETAINTNTFVPLEYTGWIVIGTLVYGTIATLVALVFFEDRDLA
jgi:ABC-type transport system involved in multi-copper enzyme maturation permease subunit